MKYDFDQRHDRRNTASMKWDQVEELFGGTDILPLWVADMDFPSPPAVREALASRAENGAFGYTIRPQSYYDAILGWLQRRHGWCVQQEWVTTCPTVVTAIALLLDILTEPGDKVLIQTPAYYSFFKVIPMNDRQLVDSPLLCENGRYLIDFEDLERQFEAGVKVMLLCSPHNPVGRVWSRDELQRLGELCLKHGVFVISDEIHFDLVYEGHQHTMFGSLSEAFAEISATCFSVSKTFNLAGLQSSTLVIPNDQLRRRYNHKLLALGLHLENYFSVTAVEAAYNHSAEWLDQLLPYLKANVDFAADYFAEHIPEIRVIKPEGTYLVWLDCRALGLDAQQLKSWMYKDAQVALSDGPGFGKQYEGYLRLNVACTRATLEEALQRLHQALPKVKS